MNRMMSAPVAGWGNEVRRVVEFRVDSIAYGFLLYLYAPKSPGFLLPIVITAFAAILAGLSLWGVARFNALFAGQLFPVRVRACCDGAGGQRSCRPVGTYALARRLSRPHLVFPVSVSSYRRRVAFRSSRAGAVCDPIANRLDRNTAILLGNLL